MYQIDKKIIDLICELENFADSNPYMWNIPHEAGQYLNLLAKSSKRKMAVEVGTSNGYSAIWLGEALKANRGKLITVEINQEKIKLAKNNFKRVGLDKFIEIKSGGAAKVLPKLDTKFDFAFIDADKARYYDWLKILEEKLLVGAIIVADNRDRYSRSMDNYLNYLKKSKIYRTFRVQVREDRKDALEISWKIK
jgi:predicted O-methyltransferase YrrM